MKKIVLLLAGLIFLQAPPFAENSPVKNYDFGFSLSGGMVKGNFSLAGELVYARKFGGVFTQFAAMTNYRENVGEYGFSLGIGAQGPAHQAYIFLDNLYRLNRLWSQVRGVYRLNFGWLNLGGSFSLPINNTRIQVDQYGVTAAKVWEADLNLIPFSWARIYASLNATSGYSRYQRYLAGVEIRPVKLVSLTAEYNKTDSHFFSNWHGYEDLRIALNLLLGSQQNNFQQKKNGGTFIVRPAYPMLMARAPSEEREEDTTSRPTTIHVRYKRWVPGGYYKKPDDYFPSVVLLGGTTREVSSKLFKDGENEFSITLDIETYVSYTGYIVDLAMGGSVASYVWLDGVPTVNLDGSDTPSGTFRFYKKNDGTIVNLLE